MPELIHTFRLPVPIERAWAALDDPGRVAAAFPGAAVRDRERQSLAGELVVKVGPVTARYEGTITVTWRDLEARRFVLQVVATEIGGVGRLEATIHVTLEPSGGATTVEVRTNLNLSGRVAQFGDGVLSDVMARMFADLGSALEAAGFPEAPVLELDPLAPDLDPPRAEPAFGFVAEPEPEPGDGALAFGDPVVTTVPAPEPDWTERPVRPPEDIVDEPDSAPVPDDPPTSARLPLPPPPPPPAASAPPPPPPPPPPPVEPADATPLLVWPQPASTREPEAEPESEQLADKASTPAPAPEVVLRPAPLPRPKPVVRVQPKRRPLPAIPPAPDVRHEQSVQWAPPDHPDHPDHPDEFEAVLIAEPDAPLVEPAPAPAVIPPPPQPKSAPQPAPRPYVPLGGSASDATDPSMAAKAAPYAVVLILLWLLRRLFGSDDG